MSDDKTLAVRNRARRYATMIIVCVHFALLWLTVSGRLGFTVDSQYEIVQFAAESARIWVPVHILNGGTLLWGVLSNNEWLTRKALSFSAGFISAWAFFALVWGLNPLSEVSLAGPVLGFGVGLGAHALVMSYVPTTKRGR